MRNGLYVDEDGTHRWYVNDLLHRKDGPAIEYPDGTRIWCKNGKWHRTDGAAVERANGTCEWYCHDKYHTFREWLAVNTKLTAKQKTILILKYGGG